MIQTTKPGICYRSKLVADGDFVVLTYLADLCMKKAKEVQCLTKFKQSRMDAVRKVLKAVADSTEGVEYNESPSIADLQPDYSAIFSPVSKKVGCYRGNCYSDNVAEKTFIQTFSV